MYIHYPKTYVLLKQLGFSPMKAAEIILDAHRKDRYALWIVRIAFRGRRNN